MRSQLEAHQKRQGSLQTGLQRSTELNRLREKQFKSIDTFAAQEKRLRSHCQKGLHVHLLVSYEAGY